jgi:AraC-like DNA-binding protein
MGKSNIDFKGISEVMNHMLEGYINDYHMGINACNDFVLPMDWNFKNRVNANFHLAYVRKGSGSYNYGSNNYNDVMKAGKIYLFSTGYCHSRTLNKRNLPHMVLMRFNMFNNKTNEPIKIQEPFGFSIEDNYSRFNNLLTDIIRNYHSSTKQYGKKIAESILEQILYELADCVSSLKIPRNIDKRLRNTAEYIQVNIHKHITLDELCHIAGLSKNYYRKLFKEEYGLYPKAYIINKRLEQAERLLIKTEYNIKEISQLLGYSDPYSFSKQFKEKIGYPPSLYKKHVKND